MKLATIEVNGAARVGVVVDETVYDLAACLQALGRAALPIAGSMRAFLAAGASAIAEAQAAVEAVTAHAPGPPLAIPLAEARLLAPLPCPGKLLCLADNYEGHISESGLKFPGKEKMIPRFFSKPCTTIIGPGDAIRIPPSVPWADWELELAVVIGKAGRDISADRASEHIAGYTIFNDVSARELAFRKHLPPQPGDDVYDWLVGKWVDTFGPMGPWLTTADEVEHPNQLAIRFWLNDELHQDGNTGQMIFSPAEAIAFISQFVSLEPGDIVSTGTPAGVGLAKKIGLKAGDRVRGEIAGLGVLENVVEAL